MKTRSRSDVELLVQLRRDGDSPLHRQLEQQLRESVRSGRLRPGVVLPSSRGLAADLGLSRGVVIEAYDQLVAEGYLVTRPGGTTQVASAAAAPPAPVAPAISRPPRIDFRFSRPDVTQFPRTAWLRSLRRVLNDAPNERFSYIGGRGAPELHEALAAYLDRVRGTDADAGHVVLSNGFAQGFSLVVRVLRAGGARRLAVEDPSDNDASRVAREAGLDVIAVPVDESGLRVDLLARTKADAVLVTAAHQFPTGAVLPPERRAALVAWAASGRRFIIEDDYDAEYRYDRTPIGAIQGLAPDRVIYAGTASKTLAPGLRLGWLVLPGSLVESVARAKDDSDRGSPVIEQLAFADFLTRGEFDHHLRRMRPLYRRRRDALLDAIARHLPELRPVGASAGLHVLTWLPPDVDEAAVVTAAARRDVGAYGVGPYQVHDKAPGLIFGYASLSPAAVEEGARLLAEALDEVRQQPG